MKGQVFRLGHMGYAAEFDVITALSALEQVLASMGQPVDFGAGRARRAESLRREVVKRVLVTDALDSVGVDALRKHGLEVDVAGALDEPSLVARLGDYEGLIVRSATKVTRATLENAGRLEVIGRAGAGVDTIDVDAATERGVIVMNTPGGNTTAVAEHTLALLLTMARRIAVADATHEGRPLGEEASAGRRAVRQDPRRPRPGPHRRRGRPPGPGLSHAGDRLRSLSHARGGRASRRGERGARGPAGPQRLHHHPHPADGRHAASAGRGRAGADQAGRAAHQLRARRHHRRAGAGSRAAERSRGGSGARRVRAGAAAGRPSAAALRAGRGHAAPGGGDRRGADRRGPGHRRPGGRRAHPRRGGQRRQPAGDGRRHPQGAGAVRRARRGHGPLPGPDGRGPHGRGRGSSTPAT